MKIENCRSETTPGIGFTADYSKLANTLKPNCYTRRTGPLTPALRRLFVERGWIDRRTVTRLERDVPTPEQAALAYRIAELSPAPGPQVDAEA